MIPVWSVCVCVVLAQVCDDLDDRWLRGHSALHFGGEVFLDCVHVLLRLHVRLHHWQSYRDGVEHQLSAAAAHQANGRDTRVRQVEQVP